MTANLKSREPGEFTSVSRTSSTRNPALLYVGITDGNVDHTVAPFNCKMESMGWIPYFTIFLPSIFQSFTIRTTPSMAMTTTIRSRRRSRYRSSCGRINQNGVYELDPILYDFPPIHPPIIRPSTWHEITGPVKGGKCTKMESLGWIPYKYTPFCHLPSGGDAGSRSLMVAEVIFPKFYCFCFDLCDSFLCRQR